MTAPRGLSEDEAAAWDAVTATVKRLDPSPSHRKHQSGQENSPPLREGPGVGVRRFPIAPSTPTQPPPQGGGVVSREGNLDSHWDRRLKSGSLEPDFTIDLHGCGLDAAYARLMGGVAQARAMGARTILLIAGKSRPVDPADRGHRRGAIRAKILDWLAASEHHAAIAAVRRAHQRHGGEGALYLVLRRER